jgi:hypothetical protein
MEMSVERDAIVLRKPSIAPITTGGRAARFRIPIAFEGTEGLVLLFAT